MIATYIKYTDYVKATPAQRLAYITELKINAVARKALYDAVRKAEVKGLNKA